MRGENGCRRTVKKYVIRCLEWITVERQRNRPLVTSHRRRKPRRHFALWVTEADILAALARAWSATTIAVILLSASVSLAPMWDRAIFLKSLLEALNTDPEMIQLAYQVPDDALANQESAAPGSLDNSDGEGHRWKFVHSVPWR